MPDITSLVFEVISPTQEGDVPRIHIDIGLSEDFSEAKSIRLLYANSRDGNYSVTIERTDASQHFTTTIDLPTYATPGWYGLINLELVTNAGQYLLYQGGQLAERGFNTVAQLDNPWGDSVSPVLEFIEVSPVQQAEDGTFRFRVKLQVSDDDSGLDPAFCQIAIGDPNGNAAAAVWGEALTPYSSGGFAEYEIGLSKYSQNGTYWIGAVTTFDLAGNHGTGQEYLSVHPITFDIVNPDADETGPAIHDFKISVRYDPVTNRPLISATVQASDDKVGMRMVGVNLTAANGLYGHELNFDGGIDVGGMKEYTGTLALPIDAVQGEYRIYRVEAMDLMINFTTLLNSDLANAGYDTIVRIYFPEDTSSGSAVVNGSSQADYVFGSDLTNDTLSGVAGNDYLYGGDGADLVSGGSGNDLVVGGSGAGDDTYIGGLGTDTVVYTSARAGMLINLSASADHARSGIDGDASGTGVDQLRGIENVIAGNHADRVTGNGAANRIEGMDGNDLLQGGGGADTLMGGYGADTLKGGLGNDMLTGMTGNDVLFAGAGHDSLRGGMGADRFVLHSGTGTSLDAGNSATVLDFMHGMDRILLDDDVFIAFNAGTAVTTQQFLSGPGERVARTPEQRLVYDESTGILFYDPDGNGALGPVQLAVFTTKPVLSTEDFLIAT